MFSWIKFLDITKSISFKSYGEKTTFFAAVALSALQQLRVQSGLLDGTAFKALLLVVCIRVPSKKGVDTSLHPSTS